MCRTATGARHAIYFVPDENGALGRFGASVLGRLPDARAAEVFPGAPPCRESRTRRPRRYGFHATLKAPFSLAPDADVAALTDTLARVAAAHAPAELGALEVRHAGASTVLACAGSPAAARARAIADAVVLAFEPFRAPLDAAARARRAPERLDPAARERLERWGYPWVFDGFDFHLTLGAGGPARSLAEDAAWLAWLAAARRDAGAFDACLDRLALCSQSAPDAPFVRVAEAALARPPTSPPSR